MAQDTGRRHFLKTAAGAALAAPLVTRPLRGANDRVNLAFIGLGRMGSGNIGYSAKVPGFQITDVCDVYQPALERAEAQVKKLGFDGVKTHRDFRENLLDKPHETVVPAPP